MRRLLVLLGVVAAAAAPLALADGGVVDITPTQVKFGKHAFGTVLLETIMLTNTGSSPVLVDLDTLAMPDDFSPGQPESTCTLPEDKLLAAGESCTHVVLWIPEPAFPGHRTATLGVTVRDASTGEVVEAHRIRLSGRAVEA